ncbi:MAG: PhzF family phenazine biosynthesis protein [Coriobacteriia bacterium]|nr:PhzF family phenazine biosynthesis protein [Coriobacteriia bacterium]
MSNIRFVIVDVFTDTPFAGNQLAVFTDARALTDDQMQMLAREFRFSECAFVLAPEAGGHARIRIFTSTSELAFAGHPVLGTAFVLGAPLQAIEVRLETGNGIVPVMLEREGAKIISGRMVQPLPAFETYRDPGPLLSVLGVAHTVLPVETYYNGARHVLVAVETEDEVASLAPDPGALAALGEFGVSCFAATGTRVKTRMFEPTVGVTEDPASGSAAGPIAVHLARHGVIAWGEEITISQGAEIGRPSTLRARAEGGPDRVDLVEVSGCAVIVGKGEFAL